MIPSPISDLAGRGDDLCRRVVAWCDTNSGSGNLPGLTRMAGLLAEACRELGAEPELLSVDAAGRQAIRLRRRPEAPVQVLLSGHYDTVYGLDHPFQRCWRSAPDRLNGPGVADMKGGLVVLFAAVAAFERSPGSAGLGWEILLTPDEETGSVATQPLLTAAAGRHGLGLVFESGRENGDLVLGRKGTGMAAVTSHGRASHAGTAPGEGRNAILALAEFLLLAQEIPARAPGVQINAGFVAGGGPINVVPDRAEAKLDVRVDSAAGLQAVQAGLAAGAARIGEKEGHRIEVALHFARPPLEAGPAAQALFAEWARCGRDLGLPAFHWRSVGGGSDANLLGAAGLPCLDGLGPRGGGYHSTDEWIDPRTLTERAQLAALFLHRLATGAVVLPGKSTA